MTGERASSAVDDLERNALLWLVAQGDFEPVVRSACDLLVEGASGDALALLAGLSVHEDRWSANLDEVIFAALSEQGRPLPPRGTEAAQTAAVRAMAAEALLGRLSPRDLAGWAHRVVGHQGAAMAQPLVELDDRYDMAEYDGSPLEPLDREALALCRGIASHRQ